MWNSNINYEINMEDGYRISTVPLTVLKSLINKVEKDLEDTNEEILLPFEFIIGSLFPEAFSSMKDAMTKQYIEGYNKGFEDKVHEYK